MNTAMTGSAKKVLISGGGIAGLTLGILLKENGWEPTVVERDMAMRTQASGLWDERADQSL